MSTEKPQTALEQTFIQDSASIESISTSVDSDVAQPGVQLVAGTRDTLSVESAALLRHRLQGSALVIGLGMAIVFVRGYWYPDLPHPVFRAATLAGMFAAFFALRSKVFASLRALRVIEAAMFAAVVLQIVLMTRSLFQKYMAEGNSVASFEAVSNSYWITSVIILIYGMFMPNTWKRAAAVVIPAALIPYLITATLPWDMQTMTHALSGGELGTSALMPIIAVVAAIYAAHTVNTIRREAFRAKQLGQYRLKNKLGSGGMGEVYEAEHLLLKRPCAIKLIRPDCEADAKMLARFSREVRATARLTHWNTVEIYDYGHSDDGTFYYVMELLPGLSLQELVTRYGPVPAKRTVHFLRQIAAALREAHAMGLIHRDIKPANVFAARRGGLDDVAKLLDFGLVKQDDQESPEAPQLTREGTISGTPLFMAPEQAANYHTADKRSDIYSVGALAYFLLTGKPPFTGRNPLEVIIAHSRDPVVPPSQIRPDIPADLERIVLRCLAKKPDDRFPDAQSLLDALEACQCAGDWTDREAARWWQDALPPV